MSHLRKGRCKFWNGAFHNTCCDAGVRYNSVTPNPVNPSGIIYRYPCTTAWPTELTPGALEHWKNKGTCEKYCEPTDEEINAEEAEANKLLEHIAKCAPLLEQIRKDHAGKVWGGIVTCPICGGSSLHVRHHPNKHVWVRCETKDCIAWVE